MATTIKNEKGVKARVKKLLDKHNYFWWMPAANGFGTQGVADFLAVRKGLFIAVETKFGGNKPYAMQRAFLDSIAAEDHFAFVVDEKNLDVFERFLQLLDESIQRTATEGKPPTDEQGAGMVDCIRHLIAGY